MPAEKFPNQSEELWKVTAHLTRERHSCNEGNLLHSTATTEAMLACGHPNEQPDNKPFIVLCVTFRTGESWHKRCQWLSTGQHPLLFLLFPVCNQLSALLQRDGCSQVVNAEMQVRVERVKRVHGIVGLHRGHERPTLKPGAKGRAGMGGEQTPTY